MALSDLVAILNEDIGRHWYCPTCRVTYWLRGAADYRRHHIGRKHILNLRLQWCREIPPPDPDADVGDVIVDFLD